MPKDDLSSDKTIRTKQHSAALFSFVSKSGISDGISLFDSL